MARITNNRMVEDLGNGAKRETTFNEPAKESENARFFQSDTFRQANIAAGQSGVQLKLGGVDSDALTGFLAGRAGTIVGIAWQLSTASTHTAGSIRASVGGTAAGTTVQIDGGGTSAVVDQATAISFNEGDALGVQITTDANWLPVTADISVWLLIRWAA